jgi:hypothetical protein
VVGQVGAARERQSRREDRSGRTRQMRRMHSSTPNDRHPFSDPSPLASLWGVLMDILDFRDEQRALTSHHFARLKEQAVLPAPDGDMRGPE